MNRSFDMPRVTPVAAMGVDARATFITRTYMHLAVAIFAFIVFEILMFSSGWADRIANFILGRGISWLFVLGGFIVVSWLASGAAHTAKSKPVQYLALFGFVFAEALIFVPLLWYAKTAYPDAGIIESAAVVTLVGFTGLTAVVLLTRKDFSFLGGILRFGFIIALVLIVGGALFGFGLGIFFNVGMIALAGGAILYDTSKVLHHYPEDRYVGAALELFASMALLFWYVLRLFLMSRD